MSNNIILIMVFGGRKFKSWKEENPRGIYDAFKIAQESSAEMEKILDNATNNQCRKQVKEFIEESKKIGLLRLVIAVVIPFSLSAILVIFANVFGFWSYPIILANLGKYALIIGFGVLVIGITWLLWCKVTKAISEDKK